MEWYPSYAMGNKFPTVQCVSCERDIPPTEDCYYNKYEEYLCQDCEEADLGDKVHIEFISED